MKHLLCCLVLLFSLTLWADDLQTVWVRADSLYKQAKYTEAAEVFVDYLKDNSNSDYQIEINYSIACYYAMAKKTDLAFKYLNTATDLGFSDLAWMQKDTDLQNLHEDKRWNQLISKLQAKEQALLATLPDKRDSLMVITLPEPAKVSAVSVEQALWQRRSVREYSEEALTLEEVSQVLWSAYGISKVIAPEYLRGGLRTAPSAGALYPLEIYLGAWNVTGLEPGFYYYQSDGHFLQLVKRGNFSRELTTACYSQEFIFTAPASLIYSAIYERTTRKYGDRGRERYVPMDLGHSAENVYLQAETLNMGTCAIGAFDDLKLRLVVPLPKAEEPLYVMPLGKKK